MIRTNLTGFIGSRSWRYAGALVATLACVAAAMACGTDRPPANEVTATATYTLLVTETVATNPPTAIPTATVLPVGTPSPSATPVQAATPTPTKISTFTPAPTATVAPAPVTLTGLTCTQTFPGAFNPDAPRSFLHMSVVVMNTSEVDVPVKIGVLGGGIIYVEYFDASGKSISAWDSTLADVTSLKAGQEYEASINADLYTSELAAACKFGIIPKNGQSMKFVGDFRANVEQIFAP